MPTQRQPASAFPPPGARSADYPLPVPLPYPPEAAPSPVVIAPGGAYPQRRRRSRLWPAAAALVALLALVGFGANGIKVLGFGDEQPGAGRPLAEAPAQASGRDQALGALLSRRAAAVAAKDQAAFLADVDRTDAAFGRRQEEIFANLMKLAPLGFGYQLQDMTGFDSMVPPALKQRFPAGVRAPAVSVSYRIDGVDNNPVAVPWVPVFGLAGGRWLLVGEVTDRSLPSGIGGQPWDAGPITVVRSKRVVGVFTAGGKDDPQRLLKLAEQALDRVAAVRPAGWAGKVFVVALRDRRVFDAYFDDNPERVGQVAAIAVPHYADVHEWRSSAEYVATRIIFNPDELSESAVQLGDDLTHEFTHAAMAPYTTGWTPIWLVEGFAEYVSYKGVQISQASLRKALRTAATEDLVTGDGFYKEPTNYVTGWLGCRMISERYGQAKLIALYEAFQTSSSEDVVIGRVLGISRADLVKQWQEYVAKQRG